MPVPDYQSLMLPALEALSGGVEVPLSKVRERVAAAEGLTAEDMRELFSRSHQTIFTNRVSWAVIYMQRAGAIDAAGTTKGVFVTAASFTRSARDYVERSPKRIVLIDGEELARLMVTHDVGVRRKIHYEVKRIDEDYFDLEDL